MRIARNLAVLLLLLMAPLAANQALAMGVGPTATCGDCTCDGGQCCSKSWAGGCSCHVCSPDP